MIPLLSPKRFLDFSAADFRAYVRSLFHKPEPRKTEKRAKKMREHPVRVKLTKRGKLSVTSRRKLKYFTDEELAELAKALGRGENEIFIALKEKGFSRRTHEEAEEIEKDIKTIPF